MLLLVASAIKTDDFDLLSRPNESLNMNRRKLLIAGSASIIILGTAGGLALHSNLKPARSPWSDANLSLEDPRLAALSFAILAPNPHNRQPWLVELRDDLGLTLYCDQARLLPETDPMNRQIVIGLGAFLELLEIAAGENGYRLQMDLFPEGEPELVLDERPVAHILFIKDETAIKDSLFVHVQERRTNRLLFDIERSVSLSHLNELASAIKGVDDHLGFTNSTEKVGQIKNLCRGGWETEVHTKRTHAESTRLTRIGEKEINANPDGISLSGPLFEGLKLAGIMNKEAMDDPASRMFQETLNFYNGLIETSMAFAWLVSPGNSRKHQIGVGRNWVRVHLAATRVGLAFHPLSQVLQEFPEMLEHYTQLHELLNIEGPSRVQGIFRLGFAKNTSPSPRWPLETRLINI